MKGGGVVDMKKQVSAADGIILLLICILTGCSTKSNALTPENILEKAFLKDKETFSEVFHVDFQREAELILAQPDNYRLLDAVELYGRTADRTDLYFVENELLQFEYQFAFSEGEEALSQALTFAKKAVADAAGRYGASVLRERYAVSEEEPLLSDYEADDLYRRWAKSPDEPHNIADAYAVSDDCVLEITLTTFDNKIYVVALNYQRPVQMTLMG